MQSQLHHNLKNEFPNVKHYLYIKRHGHVSIQGACKTLHTFIMWMGKQADHGIKKRKCSVGMEDEFKILRNIKIRKRLYVNVL